MFLLHAQRDSPSNQRIAGLPQFSKELTNALALVSYPTLQSGRIGKGREMSERHVVLGVSRSIAAYKAVDLASRLLFGQPAS